MYLEATTDPAVCAPLLFLAFIVAILFSIGILQHNKFMYCLMETARSMGLKYDDAGFFYSPKLTGTYRGRYISIYSYTKHLGDKKSKYTRVEAEHHGRVSAPISLSVDRVLSHIGEKIGVHDIHTLNREFDSEFFVRGGSEVEVKRILDSEVQHLLLEAKLPVDITKSHILHEKSGYITDKEYLRKAIDLVVDIAERIDKQSTTK